MIKLKNYLKNLLIPVALFVTGICTSQEYNFNTIITLIKNDKFLKAINELKTIKSDSLSRYDWGMSLYLKGECYYRLDIKDIGFQKVMEAKDIFIQLDSKKEVIDSNLLMQKILGSQNSPREYNFKRKKLVDESERLSNEINYWFGLAEVYRARGAILLSENESTIEETILAFRKVISYALKINDSLKIGEAYQNISFCLELYGDKNKIDSVFFYAKEAERLFIKYTDNTNLSHNYNNRALTYADQGKYKLAISYLKKAESIPIGKNSLSSQVLLYRNLSNNYNYLGDSKNALFYLIKSNSLKDSLNEIKKIISISEVQEKYDNQKLKAEKLKTEIKRKRDQLLLLGSIMFILIGSILSYLTLKNSRRKRLLALQEKELETQKNLNLLKEQEITSINAMVEGQEKERKRVAEDLHDNLGSVIATLKLHFENLKINREKKKINQDVLFEKTETLIDEAYLKVRSIAHAKNAGVIANQGLLVAVQMMAEKISSANSLQIEVVHFGLEKPIENSLEISLFRIIQELITNVIKHAEANEATINISQHENNINIIIEDNGKGINVSQMNTKKGMGIHSIKTRINHLQGTFTIDSTPTKGTSILIDVPV